MPTQKSKAKPKAETAAKARPRQLRNKGSGAARAIGICELPAEDAGDFLALLAGRLDVLLYRGSLQEGALMLDYASPGAESLTGHTPSSLCARPNTLYELIHADDRKGYREGLQKAANEGSASLQYRIVLPDGTLRRCRDEITLDGSKATGFLLGGDTGRETAPGEDEILRQRRAIIEQAAHPIVLCDTQGRVTAGNGAAQRFFALTVERFGGQDFAEALLEAESRAPFRAAVKELLEQPGEQSSPSPLKLTARHSEGRGLPVAVMVSVLMLAGQRCLVCELHDISEQINAEAELDRVWRLLRDAVDNIPTGFAIYGEDQRLILCNTAYASLYDSDPDAMVGSATTENFLRARLKMKTFDGHEIAAPALAEDNWLADDRLWLETLVASEKEPVEFQLQDGTWLQTSTHPIHGGGRVYLRSDITKLKRVEESLRQSEIQFRTLVENNPLPLWLTDTYSGDVLYHSPAAAELLGYSWPVTEYYKSVRSFATPEEREACTSELIEKGRLDGRKTRLRKADGTEFWGAVSSRLAKLGDRTISIGTVVDLTDQLKKEDELREARATLHDAVESLTEGFALYDAEDRLVMCNQRYRDFNFMTADLLKPGMAWIDFIRAGAERGQYVGTEGRIEEWLEERKALRRQFRTDMEFKQTDGRWFQFSNQRTRQGGIVVTRSDITNRKEMERALRDSEMLVRSILEAAPIPVAMTRAEDGLVIYQSPAARAIFGQMQQSGEPSYIGDLYVDPEDRRRYLKLLRERGTIEGYEVQLRKVDGSLIWASLTASLIHYQGEEMIVASASDLTERRAVEAQMARQRDALYQSEKLSALGALLAGVAHELNNPLSVVVGHAQLLKETASDPRIVERATKIGNAADRCSRIVKSFLAMARQRPPERRAVDLRDIVQATLDVTGYSLRTANIEVRLDLGPEVPAVWADSDQLNQVVTNIIVNAQQAMMEIQGPRVLSISARHDDQKDRVVMTLSDTGPGIPEDIRNRIFEPFFTTKDIGEGTGVGLAVSHRIVEAHDGRIDVDSVMGKGTVFTLALPASAAAAAMPETSLPRDLATPTASILIIDDEPEVAQMLADILAAEGHRVVTAESGEKALDLIDGERFDVILSDVRMPKLDGPSLYATLERRDPSLLGRTAFVSGDTLSPSARIFLQRVQRPFIEKPFTLDEVRDLVGQILSPKRPQTTGKRDAPDVQA
jgi:PAS domain S-box-containing protein